MARTHRSTYARRVSSACAALMAAGVAMGWSFEDRRRR